MVDKERLVELAERVEAATGPDRELDIAIHKATFVGDPNDPWAGFGDFTASLDAAMTLVSEDLAVIQMHRLWVKDKAQLYDGFTCVGEGTARSPALALCAAALRASQEQSQ